MKILSSVTKELGNNVIPLITGSEIPLAYISVARVPALTITQLSQAGQLVGYAYALRERKARYIGDFLSSYLIFSTFVLLVLLSFSDYISAFFGVEYKETYILISIFSLAAYIRGINNVLNGLLTGSENVDEKGLSNYRKIIKSFLFKVPLINFLANVSLLVILPIALYPFRGNHLLEAETYAYTYLAFGFILLAVFTYFSVKSISKRLMDYADLKGICISSITMFSFYYIAKKLYDYETVITSPRTVNSMIITALIAACGGLFYIISAYIFSPFFKKLIRKTLLKISTALR